MGLPACRRALSRPLADLLGRSLALRIVRLQAQQLQASVTVGNHDRARFTITFPIRAEETAMPRIGQFPPRTVC